MAYVTRAEVLVKVPAPHLLAALDDDGDGVEDDGLLDAVIDVAEQEVNAALAGRYTVPFADPEPAVVRQAALVFACEGIYARRPVLDKNPFAAMATAWRTRLEKIGNGELPLAVETSAAHDPGVAVTETLATEGSTL